MFADLQFNCACACVDPRVVPSYIRGVRILGRYLTGGDLTLLSKQRLRRLSKQLGCKEYGERWWKTYKVVNNIPEGENRIPEYVIAWLKTWFELYKMICRHMIKFGMLGNRKTLLSYNYVYRQLLWFHDHAHGTDWLGKYGWWFNVVKTQKRGVQCDQHWKYILDYAKEKQGLDLPYNAMYS